MDDTEVLTVEAYQICFRRNPTTRRMMVEIIAPNDVEIAEDNVTSYEAASLYDFFKEGD
ncbi:hypothetical protein [Streptacidiphilus albus]|uniref:hypothetical protein n=1 Tax=Streptacidiphilus albus TaxID=105425 RepID=UPI0012E08B7D|nr:hypothetical protein [Streptacidiphilus albus]